MQRVQKRLLSADKLYEPSSNQPLLGESQLTEPSKQLSVLSPPAIYNPEAQIGDFGIRGWLRTLHLVYFFLSFGLKLYLDKLAALSTAEELDTRFQRFLYWFAKLRRRGIQIATLNQRRAVWLTDKIAVLGPTFIKIGQTLSTRPDIVPVEYVKEFARLQDQVPEFSNTKAWKIIERELGSPPEEIFATIDPQPIAAASLGQVYKAELKTGEVVAVKVQRPGVETLINLDLAIIRQLATYIERKYPNIIFGIEWRPIVEEFAQIIFQELNYLQEAENAETFRKNFAQWKEIYVPTIYPDYSSRRVLVEEFIEGFKVDDIQGLSSNNFDPLSIVKLISKTYLKQLLEDGFFHADPHPGNLRVMRDGRLAFFDFGMVGRLTSETQTRLVDCFFYIVEKDVHGIVKALIDLKFVKEGFDAEEFRPAIEEIFAHYVGLKIGQLKFRELTQAISETLYNLPITFPADITFVMRALTTIEGLGILIDPSFSFFDTVKPYAKEFMLKREGRHLRDRIFGQLMRGENGNISWSKVWKLAKMAFKFYLGSKDSQKR